MNFPRRYTVTVPVDDLWEDEPAIGRGRSFSPVGYRCKTLIRLRVGDKRGA
jgi:hypothetical protein